MIGDCFHVEHKAASLLILKRVWNVASAGNDAKLVHYFSRREEERTSLARECRSARHCALLSVGICAMFPPLLLPLDPSQRNALHKEALAKEEDQQHRQQHNQRHGHHVVEVHLPILTTEHVEPHRQHLLVH